MDGYVRYQKGVEGWLVEVRVDSSERRVHR